MSTGTKSNEADIGKRNVQDNNNKRGNTRSIGNEASSNASSLEESIGNAESDIESHNKMSKC